MEGGIFAESLARTIPRSSTIKSVTAIDPSATLIRIAREHTRTDPILDSLLRTGEFEYKNTTAEQHQGNIYDVVTLFEVLEHIDSSSPALFLQNCLRLVRPGGWLIGSTIARSLPSFLVNRVIAEAPWPVGVVPRGTHDWNKFVNPAELRSWVSGNEQWRCNGVVYFPGLGWKFVPHSENWGELFLGH